MYHRSTQQNLLNPEARIDLLTFKGPPLPRFPELPSVGPKRVDLDAYRAFVTPENVQNRIADNPIELVATVLATVEFLNAQYPGSKFSVIEILAQINIRYYTGPLELSPEFGLADLMVALGLGAFLRNDIDLLNSQNIQAKALGFLNGLAISGEGNGSFLIGSDFDDIFYPNLDTLTIDGRDGYDSIDFSHFTAPITVDLRRSVTENGQTYDGTITYGDGLPENDRTIKLRNVEHIIGTSLNDVFFGHAGADHFTGGGGDDIIHTHGGVYRDLFDLAEGGAGNDKLFGANGRDRLRGDAGDDHLHGGAEWFTSDHDELSGGDGDDILQSEFKLTQHDLNSAQSRNTSIEAVFAREGDNLNGDAGNDIIIGGDTSDNINGGDGRDIIISSFLLDALNLDETADISAIQQLAGDAIQAGDGDDFVLSGDGDDAIDAGAGDDFVDGLAGNDVIIGGLGADVLLGGNGDDIIFTQFADRSAVTDQAKNIAFGGVGNDAITGGAGADILIGGSDDDRLEGGKGDDRIWLYDGMAKRYGPPGLVHELNTAFGEAGQELDDRSVTDTVKAALETSETASYEATWDSLDSPVGADTVVFQKGDNHDAIYGFEWADTFEIHGYDREQAVLDIVNPNFNQVSPYSYNLTAHVVFFETAEQAALARMAIANGVDIDDIDEGRTGDQFTFYDTNTASLQLDEWSWGG